MGRAKKSAVIGKLRLIYPKKDFDTSKLYTVCYEYNYDRKIIRKAAPFKARVRDWNESANNGKGGLRASYGEDYIRDTNRMLRFLGDLDDKIREYSSKHPNQLNADIIRSLLNDAPLTRDDEGKDFVEFVNSVMEERLLKNRIKYSRYENASSNMRIFREFLISKNKGTYKADSIYLGEISMELINEYIEYRKTVKHNCLATINHSLTPIIMACKKAAAKHYIPDTLYNEIADSRVHVDASTADDSKFDGKYLTREDLQRLVVFYNNDTEQRRKEYIEMFLFAFHAGGMRLVDIMTLQWKHINFEKKELKKVLIKTMKFQKKRNTVPLTPPAIAILEKWQAMGRRARFVFDLVEDDFDIDNATSLYKVRNTTDKKVNQALNVVGKKLNLPFSLSFHSARHSFAINALNSDRGKEYSLDMYEVSRLLGHSSTDVTEKVYGDYLTETLEERMNKLDFNFLPDFNFSESK